MKIKIIALGKIKEKFLKDGIDEFLKRLTPYTAMEIVELSPVEIKDNQTEKALLEEGEKILANIKPNSYVITMEILGKQLSSEDFAAKINEITISGISELVFVIGSSCG
ncbi:23S rRNA (pseudouridine(1915)-N(3))-methyltransferase RlmH, partial [bacterium]|nr:23S rRNA (pseudouridine(1915)-N(3))-methyltransferase RlmH [bacterium]